ncbi:zinc finger protein 813-like [Anopheles stephensi]|uniref:zinc finger protein 813-like n=1 Tax=Anopheles stephensi TaxID=30069 RepID=UPI001658B789|nr:zinc finger protein 813-like [Anopheles stephensi]
MEYNNAYNKPYCGNITQPLPTPGSAGFFPANDTTPATFLKVPNPPYIKQESVTGAGDSVIHAGTVTPPVNYSQNQQHQHQYGADYGESNEAEKPLFYHRKPFEMSYLSNPYMQPHAQQYPQHALPPHFPSQTNHPHHVSHLQQQPQQPLPAPPPLTVPSDMHSPQQLGPEHMQRSQHPANFHEYYDHSDAGSALEPYAYVLQKPTAAPMLTPDTSSPLVPTPFVPALDPPTTRSPYGASGETPQPIAFKCELCPKTFETRLKLEKHGKTHLANGGAPQQDFKCRMCDKTFRTKSTLICHEKVHGENGVDNSFSCVECGKVFATADKLQVHRRLHTGEKPYQCKVCQKYFNHQSNLIVHQRIHDKVKKALKCARCSKVLDNEERLAIHMRLHTGEKPYKCSYCEKRFNHKSTVSTHEKAAHIAANSYKCERCHKTFNQKCQLQYHEKLQEEHTIACAHCEKVFCYKASHKEHMFKVHFPRPKKEQKKGQPTAGDEQEGGEGADGAGATHSGGGGGGTGSGNQGRNKFKCNVCDRRFYYKRALEVHMGVHDASLDVNVLYFSCNYCPETFTEEESLQKHEAKHEADGTTDFLQNMKQLDQSENPANGQVDGGFRCPLCFKRFENQRALRDHHKTHLCSNADCAKCGPAHSDRFELAHSTYDANDDLQPTVCNICHRQLATFEQYQNHFHYHTSRVPFYCYHCREEFNDKRELYNHSRTHVPREPESYTCEVCAKVFSTKGNFKRHLKSHQAVRAFACDRCSKQYDYKSALEVHLKRSHGIEL